MQRTSSSELSIWDTHLDHRALWFSLVHSLETIQFYAETHPTYTNFELTYRGTLEARGQ